MLKQDNSLLKNVFGFFAGLSVAIYGKLHIHKTLQIENAYTNKIVDKMSEPRPLNESIEAACIRQQSYKQELRFASFYVRNRYLLGMGLLSGGVYTSLYNLYTGYQKTQNPTPYPSHPSYQYQQPNNIPPQTQNTNYTRPGLRRV